MENRKRLSIGLVIAVLLLAAGPALASGEIVGWGSQVVGPVGKLVKIAAGGNHSLGLKSDGSIVGWGSNGWGQCSVPSPNTGFVAVAAGGSHSLGLKSDGSIVAWGSNYDDNYYAGQCNVPSPNTGVVAMAAAGYHALGLKSDGSIAVWGGNIGSVPSPNTGFVAVAAGAYHALGLKSDGSIVAWGAYNEWGECNVPPPNTGFVAVAAGVDHSLGLKTDGSIVAWGYSGLCIVPTPNTGFVAVAAGDYHSLGLKSDGSIVAWGENGSGQCSVPSPNTGFVAVAAGGSSSLGLKSDGSIVAWGSTVSVPSPNTGFVAVAPGLGIKSDGSVAANPAIQRAKLLPEGQSAVAYGGIVTAAWPDVFYVEAEDRSCGIRVQKTGHGLTAGKSANVAGIVGTNADGERYLDASFAVAGLSGSVAPLGLSNRSLGGGNLAYSPGPPKSGQQGITGASGLNNIALLVRTSGKVTPGDTTSFFLHDGSGVSARVVVPDGVTLPAANAYVAVTGISSCEMVSGEVHRLLRVRRQSDIDVLMSP